jgi:hypothetical protein
MRNILPPPSGLKLKERGTKFLLNIDTNLPDYKVS